MVVAVAALVCGQLVSGLVQLKCWCGMPAGVIERRADGQVSASCDVLIGCEPPHAGLSPCWLTCSLPRLMAGLCLQAEAERQKLAKVPGMLNPYENDMDNSD